MIKQNYKLEADIHTHTIASGHAYGTIREMALAAAEQNITLLGLSEHGPGIPGTTNPFYFNNLGVIPRTLYGVSLIHGCEINVLKDGKLSLEEKYIKKLDYAIAGIHCQCYENVGIVQNTDNLIKCMRHPKVRLISHPDDDHTPLDYERLVKAAKENHVALEVNNSSFLKLDKRWNCIDNYKKMLSICQEHEVPIIVSSDAHDPSGVGQFKEATRLLMEIEFDSKLILNTSAKKLWKFLSE